MSISSWSEELRHAWRSVWAQPWFSLLVTVVLGSGLACVLFMLSVINGLMIKPLPFADADRLSYVGWQDINDLDDYRSLRAVEYFDLLPRLPAGVQAAGYYGATVNLSDNERPERFDGAVVAGDLFGVLGTPPALGRTFNADDNVPGAAMTVVLSDRVWRTRYNADPKIIDRVVRVNAQTATVIGVMPPDFSFPIRETVWIPARSDLAAATALGDDGIGFATLLRIPVGADANVRTLFDAFYAEHAKLEPDWYKPLKPLMLSASNLFIDQQTRALLGIMLGAVCLVLLVACANTANLLLTRTLARRQELAVRAAVGADRGRLVWHVLAQCLVLALFASIFGVVMAQLGVTYVMDMFFHSDDGPPQWMHFDLDARMAAATVGFAVLAAVLSGLLPALRAGGTQLNEALRDGSKSPVAAGFARVSRYLVVAEVALSCVLLISAGVMVRAIVGLTNSDIGIHGTDRLLTARIALFPEQYPTDAERVRVFERLVEQVRADPQVEAATIANVLPGNIGGSEVIAPEGYVAGEAGYPIAEFGSVDDYFLQTYQVRLLDGREFDQRDTAESLRVALVDREFVAEYWPDGQALGKRFRVNPQDAGSPFIQVVGVIDNLQLDDIDDPRRPTILVPMRQAPERFVSLAVRTRGEPLAFSKRLVEVMRGVDADTPLYWLRDFDEVARLAIFGERLLAQLFSVFGIVGLVLAAAGLYGLIAFNVGARTREIGLRRALGAPDRHVLAAVLGRSGWQVGIGLVLGVILGIPFARLLVGQLPGVAALDASAVLPVLLVLALTTTIAALVPARRAMRVDPMQALRYE